MGVKPEQVTLDASIEKDWGADSLTRVSLLMRLEDEFGLEIPDEEAETLTTVEAVVGYLRERVRG